MKKFATCCTWLLALCATGAHAQLYKSVGPDGKVTYSDAPPASAARVETKSIATGGVSTGNLPYELAEAVRNNPVTLYSTEKCAPCDDGRKLLQTRGVPFSEKTVTTNEDTAQFKKVSGGESRFPVLYIGRHKEAGYLDSTWNTALTAAGYPETSKLPRSYRNPPAQALAPKPTEAAAERSASNTSTASSARSDASGEPPPPAGNAPPGFRF